MSDESIIAIVISVVVALLVGFVALINHQSNVYEEEQRQSYYECRDTFASTSPQAAAWTEWCFTKFDPNLD